MVAKDVQHPRFTQRSVSIDHCHRHVARHPTPVDAAYPHDTHVRRVLQSANLHLQVAFGVHRGRRYVFDDRVEQRLHILGKLMRLEACDTVDRRGVHHGEVELRVVRPKTVEKIEYLVDHAVGFRRGPVNLVHDDDRV